MTNLHEGPLILPDVVALGDTAVPELESLLRGPPDSIHQPRCLVADALAAIGSAAATHALVRALRDSIARELDPTLQAAEDVVVNCIAVHLARRPEPTVADALLAALRVRAYPYCALALGRMRDQRAIPLLVRCLRDDAARWAAIAALRQFGCGATSELIDAVSAPCKPDGLEPPTWVEGRAAAATLIGEIGGQQPAGILMNALQDEQRAVRIAAALALVKRGPWATRHAAPILVAALDESDWTRAEQIIEALSGAGRLAGEFLLPVISCGPKDRPDQVRRLRAVRIAGRAQLTAAVPWLARLADANDSALRLAAITALARIPAANPADLTRFLADTDAVVRYRALEAAHRRGVLTSGWATRLLGDPNELIRQRAERALRDSGHAAVPALRATVCHLGRPLGGFAARSRAWWGACRVLARLWRSHARSAP